MKVIDLLNKVANDEMIPGKIKYGRKIYHYGNYIRWYITDDLSKELFIDRNNLNDEIEIIEDTPKEDKKIEHINKVYDLTDFRKDYPIVAEMLKDVSMKQYEIIDRLNGEK